MMMKGLLDFVSTPEGQGLLSAVAGGMASARRGAPVNSIGRGLLAGVQGYGNALDRQQQEQDSAFNRQFRDMQMGQMRAALEQQQGQQAWKQGLPAVLKQSQEPTYGAADEGPTMTPPDPQKLQNYLMDPRSPFADKVLEAQLFPKAPETITVGDTVLDARTFKPVYQAPEKPKKTSIEEMLDAGGITDPATRQSFILQALKKQTTHAPPSNTSVTLRQETEESKKVGGFFGEEYGNILKSGTQAQSKLNRYSRLGELLQGVQTGKFTETGLEVAKTARSLGFNVSENVGNLEAAQSLAGEIALELRNPSGGAGMPGAMSDADRQFLVGMVPGLATTPEGRALMLETAQKLAKRDIEIARLARDYRKRNGSIDEGFYDELARFSAANPLFKGVAPIPQTGQGGFTIRRTR